MIRAQRRVHAWAFRTLAVALFGLVALAAWGRSVQSRTDTTTTSADTARAATAAAAGTAP